MSATATSIGTEKVGSRIYVTGNTYAVKSQLKDAGCHWDGERKQWWIGATKVSAIEALIGGIASGPPPKEDLSRSRVYGKVAYKGRQYYVIAEGQDRLRLTVLDGAIDFWADRAACELVKRYQPRTSGYGRYAREEYQTLGSIQRFISDQKNQKNESTRRGECTECGSWGPSGEPCQDCGGEGHHA